MISLAMIVGPGRAEEARKAIASVRSAVDEVILVFPCNDDKALRALGIDCATRYAFFPQACDPVTGELVDFGMARNEAWKMARGQWKMWLDSDDTVLNPDVIRELVDKAPEKGNIWYTCSYQGNMRERLVRDPDAYWFKCVHESLTTDGSPEIVPCPIELKHDIGERKDSNERNVRLLNRWLKTHPNDAWAYFELGREAMMTCDFDLCIRHLTKWDSLYEANDEFRLFAYLMMTETYIAMMKPEEAMEKAFTASRLFPNAAVPKRLLAWIMFVEACASSDVTKWETVRFWAAESFKARDNPALNDLLRNSGCNTPQAMKTLIAKADKRLEVT